MRCASGCSTSMSTPGTSSRSSSSNLLNHLLAALVHVGIHAEDVFARIHRRGMFVHFRPARAADEVQDLAVGIGRRLLPLAELLVDQARRPDSRPPATNPAAA